MAATMTNSGEQRTAGDVPGQDVIREAIRRVADGHALSRAEAAAAMDAIMSGETTNAQISSLVTALRMRGETDEEIAGFAEAMRRHALRVPRRTDAAVVDTCGTGGDGANTFNISTTAAFVVAGAGVPVAKHGNRAASSRCGSADVLEGLGVRVDLAPEAVATCIDEAGIGFMFAQVFHPAMRFAGPVRKEIAIRTIFNILGPLTNPAGAEHQVVGAASPVVAEKLARALGMLGTRHALVVHSRDGLDELSLGEPNLVSEVRVEQTVDIRTYELRATEVGLARAPVEALRGGDVADNVALTRSVLSGGNGAPRAVTLLNAGAAIYAADRASSIEEGIQLAAESIDSGAALARLKALVDLSTRLSGLPS